MLMPRVYWSCIVKIRLGKKKGENFYDVTYNLHLISGKCFGSSYYKHAVKSGFEANCCNCNPQSDRRKEELISVFGNVFPGAVLQNRSSDAMLIMNKGKNTKIFLKTFFKFYFFIEA